MSASEQAEMLQILAAKDIKALRSLIDPNSADDEIFDNSGNKGVNLVLPDGLLVSKILS